MDASGVHSTMLPQEPKKSAIEGCPPKPLPPTDVTVSTATGDCQSTHASDQAMVSDDHAYGTLGTGRSVSQRRHFASFRNSVLLARGSHRESHPRSVFISTIYQASERTFAFLFLFRKKQGFKIRY